MAIFVIINAIVCLNIHIFITSKSNIQNIAPYSNKKDAATKFRFPLIFLFSLQASQNLACSAFTGEINPASFSLVNRAAVQNCRILKTSSKT